jgi:4-diphosphocytidyl-2-C-methyl-D-erythritol kinase
MFTVNAPAKINLGLKVKGRDNKGYHLLDTIYTSIDLYDEIKIFKTNSNIIKLTSNNCALPLDRNNLIIKTLEKVGINRGLSIHLEKRIPVGGGMAGGSSDAAAILKILPKLGVHLTDKMIKELAISLGADVYYCYIGGIQRAGGIGEVLRSITPLKETPKIAVLPQNINCDTKDIFKEYDMLGADFYNGKLDLVEEGIINGDFEQIENNIDNSLENAIFNKHPKLKEKVIYLRDKNLNIQISGSGSTLYMVLKNEHDIIKLKNAYEDEFIVCNIINNK